MLKVMQCYPSPLNYCNFPKSVCTSPNEVICHGIPDQRVLQDGDILNIDISLYHDGFHSDLNETYYIGDKAMANPNTVRVVEAARECLAKAIEIVKPGTLFREYGNVIEKHAKSQNCSVIRTYCGHGINSLFHCAPNIPHYAKNKATGQAKPGMCFTIEPMISIGSHKDKTWPDDWTSVTQDGSLTAQFGRFSRYEMCTRTNLNRAHPSCNRRRSRDIDCKIARLTRRSNLDACTSNKWRSCGSRMNEGGRLGLGYIKFNIYNQKARMTVEVKRLRPTCKGPCNNVQRGLECKESEIAEISSRLWSACE